MKIRTFASMAATLAIASTALCQQPVSPQYLQTNLVADSTATATAKTIDPNLSGAWGLSESSTGPWWLSDNNNGLSTLYNGLGATQGLVVTVPTANPDKSKTGTPTGILFNASSSSFLLSDGKAASFLFATLDGLIVGWNGGVSSNTGEIAINQSSTSSFTGIAVAPATIDGVTSTYLYAADFLSATVDVFDTSFHHVPQLESAFAAIPLPAGYAPFNIQNIGGNLYVTLALQNQAKNNQVTGPGLGYIAAVSPEGIYIGVAASGLNLNAPWGVAVAPGNFGQYSHDLLVGNNGDGTIAVFNPVNGGFIAKLKDANNNVISINGLWGLAFGSDSANGGPATTLYFAAAPGTGGLFGTLTPLQNTFGSDN